MLESAFNIVYGQPNRSFLRGKLLAVALMLGSLVTLFLGLLVGSFGYDLLTRYAAGFVGNSYVAYGLSVAVSTLAVFVFLFAVYYLLTNDKHSFTDVLPGAIVAAVLLEASFQVLPIYVRFSNNVLALQAFGAPGSAARLAVRDGERDRLRRRGELVSRGEAPPAAAPTSKRPPASPRSAEQ